MMEAFLAEYGLSTEEGVGLMCLAEALLRVPDPTERTSLVDEVSRDIFRRLAEKDLDCGVSPHVFVTQPGAREQLPEALADLAERGIDLLVINGGDGTVRDVLTSGASIFGEHWPTIAVLPKGKTVVNPDSIAILQNHHQHLPNLNPH